MTNNNANDFLGLKESGPFGVLLVLYWTLTSLPFYARGVIVRLMGSSVEPYVLPFFFIVATLLSILTIVKATRWWDYLLMTALILFFFGCYSWFPANKPYLLDYEDKFLYWSLPFFIVGVATNFKKCQRLLYVFSATAIFLQLLSLFSGGVSVNNSGDLEDMGRAYGIMPPLLFMIWKAFEDKSVLSIVIAVMGVLSVLFMGTRGPVILIVEFIAIYLLFFGKYKNPYTARIIIVVLSLLTFFLLNYILDFLIGLSSALGFSVRALETFSNSADVSQLMVESSGRDVIYDNLIDAIRKAPFWGYGPGADHIYSNFYEVYAHNIVLEMLIEYGLVPGLIILLSIVTLFAIAIIKNSDYNTKVFLLICFTCGFLGLMTSSTYWTSRAFFFMLGVCVSVIRNSKKQISFAR